MPLPVRSSAFWRIVLKFDVANTFSGFGIEGCECVNRPAVIGQNDKVVRLVIHDPIQTALTDWDLLDRSEGLEIEHRHRLVATIRRKAVSRFGGNAGAMNSWGIRNVAEDLA